MSVQTLIKKSDYDIYLKVCVFCTFIYFHEVSNTAISFVLLCLPLARHINQRTVVDDSGASD